MYTAYGLVINSALALPEFTVVADPETSPDVHVRFGDVVEVEADEVPREYGSAYITKERVYYRHPRVGIFEIKEGRTITIQRGRQYDEEMTRMCITNLAMGIILHQRNVFTLHASAAEIDGEAVVFLGDKGAGKSTMVTALSRRGHKVITDDVLGVLTDADEGQVRVVPGYAQVKLLPDAVAHVLNDDPEHYQRVYAATPKRIHTLAGSRTGASIPLRTVYRLSRGDQVAVEPIAPQQAFLTLMRQAYLRRLIQPTQAAAWYLKACTTVANEVGIYHLRRPRDFALFPQIIQYIEENRTDVQAAMRGHT
ncbi:MAG: hypothetical protein GVY12_07800 [Bacteroidetes bacterium]|jgi:energy-coupling factor transporter ATP-binding protein EcfA2|nr:hypothetical protein [Bacteroidota bacterium]